MGRSNMKELVTINKSEGIAMVTLTRPETFNAFNLDMIESLAGHLITLAADQEIRAIIVTGEGKAFCAGGDLKWVLAFPRDPPPLSMNWLPGSIKLFWRFAACRNRS